MELHAGSQGLAFPQALR